MYQFTLEIEGLTPLLMSNLDPLDVIRQSEEPKKPSAAKNGKAGGKKQTTSAFEGSPWEWRARAYWTDEGVGLYIKADCLETCLLNASRKGTFKVNKKAAANYIAGGFILSPEKSKLVLPPNSSKDLKKLALKGPDAFPINKDKIGTLPDFVDVRTVVIRATKGRNCRYRVLIPLAWSASFKGEMLHDEVKPDFLETILAYAGNYQGLLDYRPKYGRFAVKSFTVIE